jgi:hypothetical protein
MLYIDNRAVLSRVGLVTISPYAPVCVLRTVSVTCAEPDCVQLALSVAVLLSLPLMLKTTLPKLVLKLL